MLRHAIRLLAGGLNKPRRDRNENVENKKRFFFLNRRTVARKNYINGSLLNE